MNLKKLKFELFRHVYFILIIEYLSLGCAGTVINPYLEDMYGKKKHIIKDVVVLLNVKEISDEFNTFEFKFYEPVLAVDPVRKRARERTIISYYDEYRDRNDLGFEYTKTRAIRNTQSEQEYYYIVTYTDTFKVDSEPINEPGLIPINKLLIPDL